MFELCDLEGIVLSIGRAQEGTGGKSDKNKNSPPRRSIAVARIRTALYSLIIFRRPGCLAYGWLCPPSQKPRLEAMACAAKSICDPKIKSYHRNRVYQMGCGSRVIGLINQCYCPLLKDRISCRFQISLWRPSFLCLPQKGQ